MAKEQDLPLNPTKISGTCGRLLCCLSYESSQYRALKEKLPPVGQQVNTPMGAAIVVGGNPLKETVSVKLETGAVTEIPLEELQRGTEKQPNQPKSSRKRRG
jgi:cell fate regulator YaaT (PSP1 superfamily)